MEVYARSRQVSSSKASRVRLAPQVPHASSSGLTTDDGPVTEGTPGRSGTRVRQLPRDGGSSLSKNKLPWAATLARVSSSQRVPGGVAHKLPTDLREALIANPAALEAWKDITPLARNEFICWVEDAKQKMTRERRIRRTQDELEEGQRRPCCWPGCRHRERTGK